MKYTLEINTDTTPAQMLEWTLNAATSLEDDATWALSMDGQPLISLSHELKES